MRRRFGVAVALAVVALAGAGCVSVGTNYSDAAVDQLRKGMTKAEVIALLGKPNAQVRQLDGTSIATWMHSKGNALGHGSSRVVSIRFDASGRYDGGLTEASSDIR